MHAFEQAANIGIRFEDRLVLVLAKAFEAAPEPALPALIQI